MSCCLMITHYMNIKEDLPSIVLRMGVQERLLSLLLTQLLQLKKCFIVYQLFSQGGLSYCVLQIFIFLNGIFLYFRMS